MTDGAAGASSSSVRARIGLIGHPVAHSLSPRMQQAALDALGITARYELWETLPDELAKRIAALRGPEMLGANVTIPYKAAVVPLLDEVSLQARRSAGVVNTIVREQTSEGIRLIGYNTDVVALIRILDEQAQWHSRRVVVLGAGGAAQAAIGAARASGADVWVAARQLDRAEASLAATVARERDDAHDESHSSSITPLPDAWRDRALTLDDPAGLARALSGSDVLVQATPVGMETVDIDATDSTAADVAPHGAQPGAALSPIPLDLLDHLPPHAFVLDMIYAPRETALVRAAHQRGLRASGGLPMLLYQGAAAFALWTDRPAPLDVMRAALGL